MKTEQINQIREQVKIKRPLVHSITNPISINQCANTVLAVWAKPIMAEHPDEVAEITETADSLLLNLGNITDARLKSIWISAEVANRKGIPFVLDAVGVACSKLRKDFAKKLIETHCPTVIKGNYSEIKALWDKEYSSQGVDAEEMTVEEMSSVAAQLARKYKTVVLASGKIDVVTDGKRLIVVKNGCTQLSDVTGTGCMLGVLCATYISTASGFDAAVTACGVLGICGELAQTNKGVGTFMVNLLDNLSVLNCADVEKYLKLEEIEIERL